MARVRQLLIGLASGSALYSGLAPALGLGEITLHSALSQPLDAEIELLNLGDLGEAEVKVRLAPPEVFNRSGVDRLYFLNDLRFTPIFSRGRGVIRVVSARPVREPYLNFIVEVSRPNGDLYREYTLLLDPPGSSAYRTAAAPLAALASPEPRPSVSSAPAPAPRASAPRELPAATNGQRYTVVSGDSLWKIAARLREAGSPASQQALMGDIHALNPSAFSRGDINRLLAGAELLLPDSAAALQPVAAQPANAAPQAAAEATSLAPVDPPSEAVSAAEALPGAAATAAQTDPAQLLQEQQRVEAELANQITETVQLQQSLAELQLQMQQLQEEMSTRDRQIAGLQAELAARSAAAQSTPQEPPQASEPAEPQAQAPATAANGWLQLGWAGLGLAALGLLGLFWRSRSRPVPPVQTVKRAHVPNQAPVAAPRPVPLSASRDKAPAGPAWPPAGTTDALQSANVYIAYGRFSEAAANLRKALESQPGRNDIRFRLLEVLAQLGDAQGFIEEEARLRASGFTPARIDELKARHAQLFAAPVTELLDDAVLQLDEEPEALLSDAEEAKLNLDDLSLDADWDLVTPFAQPKAKQRVTSEDVFELGSSRDARSPFAENMLVEESSNSEWVDDELDEAFADSLQADSSPLLQDLDHLAGNQDNLTKLNMALAYIEQGSLESACNILNEVIAEGNEQQKQEARQLLAKIA